MAEVNPLCVNSRDVISRNGEIWVRHCNCDWCNRARARANSLDGLGHGLEEVGEAPITRTNHIAVNVPEGCESWWESIPPIDYENEGDEKMNVYIGVVVQTTEEGQEIVYESKPILAKSASQARNILLAAAVRQDENLDPATLSVRYTRFDEVE